MKILILGVQGMLGSRLSDVLKDWDPTCWDRSELDITDLDAVRAKMSREKPEVIINAAAYTNVDGAEGDGREVALAVNEHGVRNLALVAVDMGAKLVHYSTDYVFPGTAKDGYHEDDTPGPAINVYGESKLAGERALRDVGGQGYLLRTAWLYGPSGKNFVDTMVRLGKERGELRVINDQWGSPTYTHDVAEYTKALLEQSAAPGVYHAVNSGVATWYELAQEVFTTMDMKVKLIPITTAEYPLPARRPRYSVLQNTKRPALRTWHAALHDYLKVYYTKRP